MVFRHEAEYMKQGLDGAELGKVGAHQHVQSDHHHVALHLQTLLLRAQGHWNSPRPLPRSLHIPPRTEQGLQKYPYVTCSCICSPPQTLPTHLNQATVVHQQARQKQSTAMKVLYRTTFKFGIKGRIHAGDARNYLPCVR